MQPKNYSEQGEVKMRRRSTAKDEDAVSEILGVIMMLAMVITIMGGVWIFLTHTWSRFMTTPTGTVLATLPTESKTASTLLVMP